MLASSKLANFSKGGSPVKKHCLVIFHRIACATLMIWLTSSSPAQEARKLEPSAADELDKFFRDSSKDEVRAWLAGGNSANLRWGFGTDSVWMPLLSATSYQNLPAVDELVTSGANPNVQVGTQTPLRLAVQKQNLDLVQILVRGGADVNLVPSGDPQTTLSLAIRSGGRYGHGNNLKIIEYLLSKGADPNANGREAINLASSKWFKENRPEVLRLIEANAVDAANAAVRIRSEDLIRAAAAGDVAKVKQLVALGINGTGPQGLALIQAAFKGHKDIVWYLVSKGGLSLLSVTDNGGNNALLAAALGGQENLVTELLQKGADPRAVNARGFDFNDATQIFRLRVGNVISEVGSPLGRGVDMIRRGKEGIKAEEASFKVFSSVVPGTQYPNPEVRRNAIQDHQRAMAQWEAYIRAGADHVAESFRNAQIILARNPAVRPGLRLLLAKLFRHQGENTMADML
jgi:ankyrin repeat protein